MTYSKPEVVELDTAMNAIQGTQKLDIFPEVSHPDRFFDTVGAYEADE